MAKNVTLKSGTKLNNRSTGSNIYENQIESYSLKQLYNIIKELLETCKKNLLQD